MEAVYSLHVFFVLTLLVCITGILGDNSSDQSNESETDDANSFAKRQYLWFGPRLGRNKRNPSEDDGQLYHFEDNMIDLIHESPWALIPIRGGERNVLSFTPRLGRNNDDEETMEASRSPPFAPRLGRRRHVVSFSPRLGRTFNTQNNHQ